MSGKRKSKTATATVVADIHAEDEVSDQAIEEIEPPASLTETEQQPPQQTAPPARPRRGRPPKEPATQSVPPVQQPPRQSRKKNAASTQPAKGSQDDVSEKLSQVLTLLQAHFLQQQPQTLPLAHMIPPQQVPAVPPLAEAFAQATANLQARLPHSSGTITITDFLTRKTQRKIKETSIDTLSYAEFIYSFVGYLLDDPNIDSDLRSKLVFIRQVSEDSEQYAWSGVLDWALTVIDHINDRSVQWSSERSIAMDRLVISRSVENALVLTSIACPEYNSGQCAHKSHHVEGRFRLNHFCSFCVNCDIEHQHTARACHRKKSFLNPNQRQNNSSRNDSRYRSRNYDTYESRNDSKN